MSGGVNVAECVESNAGRSVPESSAPRDPLHQSYADHRCHSPLLPMRPATGVQSVAKIKESRRTQMDIPPKGEQTAGAMLGTRGSAVYDDTAAKKPCDRNAPRDKRKKRKCDAGTSMTEGEVQNGDA